MQPGGVLVGEVLLVAGLGEVPDVAGDLLCDRERLTCVLDGDSNFGHPPEDLYSALNLRGSVDRATLLHVRVVPVAFYDELLDLVAVVIKHQPVPATVVIVRDLEL